MEANGTSKRPGLTIEVFDSFEEADAEERRRNHARTPVERLNITERLRAQYYGYAETGVEPRLERTLKVLPFP